jgi:(1->4)-alpha-D-glucan 1-alpha-D-glucosylmutase
VLRWRRFNKARKRVISDGRAVPDANEEYLLYQTLVGMWPSDLRDEKSRSAAIGRVQQYMRKAVHEAKVNLSWVNQNPEYIEALDTFIERVLKPENSARPNVFLTELEQLIAPVTFFGAINSLAQTLLKITVPGVPDFYQGTELWDYSLVDPDNRQAIDFALRERTLEQIEGMAPSPETAAELLGRFVADRTDGAIKLFTILRGLRFRQENGTLFRSGSYVPLFATGPAAQHVCAFARELNAGSRHSTAIVVVPRLSYTLMQRRIQAPIGDVWGETEITLPPRSANEFENIFTGTVVRANTNRSLLCREVFAQFPVALLTTK